MIKQAIFAGLLTVALGTASGTLAQTMNYGTTNSGSTTTMSPSPATMQNQNSTKSNINTDGSGLQNGQGAGSGTSMPNGAPNTGEGGSQ